MQDRSFWLTTMDATRMYVHHWLPDDNPPHASLIICHGMAEHGGRYRELATALTAAGISVYAADLRGHGQTASEGVLGHFGDHDGWSLVIEDLRALNHHVRCATPHAPLFILGHGLGSYLIMGYLMQYSCSVQGVMLSGAQHMRRTWKYRLARALARLESVRQGPRGRSRLLHWLLFRRVRSPIQPRATHVDWLSSDAGQVQSYLADPLCGFLGTNQLWLDIFNGLQRITPVRSLHQINHQLPLLVFGGEQDPVHQGERLLDLAEALRQSGKRNVDVKLYPDMRHEPLKERQRQRVFRDLIEWMGQHCSRPDQPTD